MRLKDTREVSARIYTTLDLEVFNKQCSTNELNGSLLTVLDGPKFHCWISGSPHDLAALTPLSSDFCVCSLVVSALSKSHLRNCLRLKFVCQKMAV